MDRAIKGYPYAKAAVEFAAYDLAGRQLGVPVYTLLGGRARDAIPMAHSIGLIDFKEAEKEVAQVIEEGIKTIKIKIGIDAGRDVEMVRRIRAVAGDGIDLCVDANNGYTTPGQAIRAIKDMEGHNIKYAEQPVEGAARLAQVARAVDVPIMADESAWNAHDVIDLAERRAAQCISIYTTKSGGLFKSMEVAAVARAAGMSVQRQRIHRNGRRQPGQRPAIGRRSRRDSGLRLWCFDAARGPIGPTRRHLLPG